MRRAACGLGLLSAWAALSAAAVGIVSCRPLSVDTAPWRTVTCFECHIDFKAEGLTVVHQRRGVTCVRCHGPSVAHMEDEDRRTPADAKFRGKAMEAFCLTCHDPGRHARLGAHAAEARRAEGRRTCTQCHGEHKLVEVK